MGTTEQKEQTLGKIYQAIPKVMAEINAVGKNKQNKQQGFMYRGVDDVMNALYPTLSKCKVFIVPEILEQKREERQTAKGAILIYSICRIRFRFFADDGSFVEAITVGEGMDSGDKATNKAMAIAFKYACFQVFCIPTEEMHDPDSETPPNLEPSREAQQAAIDKANSEPIDKTKISVIRNTIMRKGLKMDSILSHYGIKSFEAMSFGMWNNAMQLLEKYPDADKK